MSGKILKMQPIFQEKIWGGNRLSTVFDYPIPSDHTGECWAISGHPNGDCAVVGGEFDGKTVKAWHIETAKDKTENLAGRAKGKHIDAVVGAECRSTGHFFSRVYKQLYKEAVSK
mgnify:CR=1 FL=1